MLFSGLSMCIFPLYLAYYIFSKCFTRLVICELICFPNKLIFYQFFCPGSSHGGFLTLVALHNPHGPLFWGSPCSTLWLGSWASQHSFLLYTLFCWSTSSDNIMRSKFLGSLNVWKYFPQTLRHRYEWKWFIYTILPGEAGKVLGDENREEEPGHVQSQVECWV